MDFHFFHIQVTDWAGGMYSLWNSLVWLQMYFAVTRTPATFPPSCIIAGLRFTSPVVSRRCCYALKCKANAKISNFILEYRSLNLLQYTFSPLSFLNIHTVYIPDERNKPRLHACGCGRWMLHWVSRRLKCRLQPLIWKMTPSYPGFLKTPHNFILPTFAICHIDSFSDLLNRHAHTSLLLNMNG